MGNPQVPKINCYSLKFRQKLSQHFGDMSQCERCEKLIFTFIGVPGRGKAKPTCKLRIGDPQVENLTDVLFANDTTLLTCHSTEICQTHIFWGFGMTGACTEGERFRDRKLDSHTFGH